MKKLAIVSAVVLIFSLAWSPASSQFAVNLQVGVAPPELPVYDQPMCPGDGYMWTPGYWAYGPTGYYWVPGVWVLPPNPGLLWTPSYWGFTGGYYHWHAGYWGEHVGFYGGVNYGFGYNGYGFGGGRWEGGRFRYNTAVVHVNTNIIHNTYVDRTVIRTTRNNRSSYNGPGGAMSRSAEREDVHENHVNATSEQFAHHQNSASDRGQFADVNHGRPAEPAFRTVGEAHVNHVHAAQNVSMNRPAEHAAPVQHMSASPRPARRR